MVGKKSPQLTPLEKLIAYAISQTGRSDSSVGSLGRTQIMKLVYLADLAHAERHEGRTYSGARWRFLHFGPWASEVQQRIDSVAELVGARQFEWKNENSEIEESFLRWSGEDVTLNEDNEPPLVTVLAIEHALKDCRGDTRILLHRVYGTSPMLHARPGEELDFHVAVEAGEGVLRSPPQTPQDKRRLRKMSEELREKLKLARERRTQTKSTLVEVRPEYDETFRRTIQWLDSMAGAVPEVEGEVVFSDEIWDSDNRRRGRLP